MEEFNPAPLVEEKPVKNKSGSGFGIFIDVLETVVLALVLFVVINAVSDRVRVENVSMQPTLYQGEFVLVNKLAYKWSTPKIGDIIIFPYPKDPTQNYIKRVIGVPGDVVSISNGTVKVNNETLVEPYIAAEPNYSGNWTVPEGKLFVLGDNRNNSSDSHAWGFVDIKQVIGKALVIYWPFNDFKILSYDLVVKAAS